MSIFIKPDDFRAKLHSDGAEIIVDELLLCDGAVKVSDEEIKKIINKLSSKFSTNPASISLWIVGSAKLGFSLHKKVTRDGIVLPRYRPFGPDSDIDVAVISQPIFDQVWNELAIYAHSFPRLPWNSNKLGDYLICGWWRPDHFPRNVRIRKCDDWWDCFYSLSKDPLFDRRSVRGGLFYSTDHLRRYLLRDVTDCKREEELEK